MVGPHAVTEIAHRDGIFRPLENIQVGAAIEVQTASFHYVYRVTSIAVPKAWSDQAELPATGRQL